MLSYKNKIDAELVNYANAGLNEITEQLCSQSTQGKNKIKNQDVLIHVHPPSTVKMRITGQKYPLTISQTQSHRSMIKLNKKHPQTIQKSSRLHPPVSFSQKLMIS